MSTAYSHRDIQDWLSTLDDEYGRFAGFELRAGRIAGLLAKATVTPLSEAEATAGLTDLSVLSDLAKVGRKWGGWLKRPPMEVEILVEIGRRNG